MELIAGGKNFVSASFSLVHPYHENYLLKYLNTHVAFLSQTGLSPQFSTKKSNNCQVAP